MNWLDIALIVILALSLFEGWRHGLLHFVFDFIGIALGILIARLVYCPLADRLDFIHANGAAEIMAFLIICTIVGITAAVLGHHMIEPRIQQAIPSWVSRLGGIVLGFVFGVALSIVIVLLLDKFVALPPGTPLEELSGIRQGVTTALNRSVFASPILEHFGPLL
jgi:uncharacterized membrane protein required for colicin V production